jgi:hypothetical protein
MRWQDMADAVARHPLWQDCSESEFEFAMEGVEKMVMNRLHDRYTALCPYEPQQHAGN